MRKEIQLWTKTFQWADWYVVKDITDINSSEVNTSYFDNPTRDWAGLNKLRIWKKIITLIVSLRKPTNYEFQEEINDLKWELLGKNVNMILKKPNSPTTYLELRWTVQITEITWNEQSAGTFSVLTIKIVCPDWYLEETTETISFFPFLTAKANVYNFILWNYYVLPIFQFVSNNTDKFDQVKLEWDGYYILSDPVSIIAGEILEFNFKTGRVYYNNDEIDSDWEFQYLDKSSTVTMTLLKNGVKIPDTDADVILTVKYFPTYI